MKDAVAAAAAAELKLPPFFMVTECATPEMQSAMPDYGMPSETAQPTAAHPRP